MTDETLDLEAMKALDAKLGTGMLADAIHALIREVERLRRLNAVAEDIIAILAAAGEPH